MTTAQLADRLENLEKAVEQLAAKIARPLLIEDVRTEEPSQIERIWMPPRLRIAAVARQIRVIGVHVPQILRHVVRKVRFHDVNRQRPRLL